MPTFAVGIRWTSSPAKSAFTARCRIRATAQTFVRMSSRSAWRRPRPSAHEPLAEPDRRGHVGRHRDLKDGRLPGLGHAPRDRLPHARERHDLDLARRGGLHRQSRCRLGAAFSARSTSSATIRPRGRCRGSRPGRSRARARSAGPAASLHAAAVLAPRRVGRLRSRLRLENLAAGSGGDSSQAPRPPPRARR